MDMTQLLQQGDRVRLTAEHPGVWAGRCGTIHRVYERPFCTVLLDPWPDENAPPLVFCTMRGLERVDTNLETITI
jgi:hypothetical protein